MPFDPTATRFQLADPEHRLRLTTMLHALGIPFEDYSDDPEAPCNRVEIPLGRLQPHGSGLIEPRAAIQIDDLDCDVRAGYWILDETPEAIPLNVWRVAAVAAGEPGCEPEDYASLAWLLDRILDFWRFRGLALETADRWMLEAEGRSANPAAAELAAIGDVSESLKLD